MALRFSEPLRDALLTTGDFKAQMDGGVIFIYAFDGATTVPGADDAVDTTSDYTLLARITANAGLVTGGYGLNFDEPSGGVITKAAAQTWDNSDAGERNYASGTAAFFVHSATETDGDALGAVTTENRIVGTVGLAGADMQLGDISLTSGQTQEITYYNLTLGAG